MRNEEKWELMWDAFRYEEDVIIDDLKHLIFDTYEYLEYILQEGKEFPRYTLPMYKNIIQICTILGDRYVPHIRPSVSATVADFLAGLCRVYERGFDTGYYERSLPLGLRLHTPAGSQEPEADMATYETFLKSFDEQTDLLRTCYGYEAIDEDYPS